jgi:hypothetical protein
VPLPALAVCLQASKSARKAGVVPLRKRPPDYSVGTHSMSTKLNASLLVLKKAPDYRQGLFYFYITWI